MKRHQPVDLGYGHTLRETMHGGVTVGYIVAHPSKLTGGECYGGAVWLDTADLRFLSGDRAYPRWHAEATDPLTLTPSLRCALCGDHGFVRAGRWEPA